MLCFIFLSFSFVSAQTTFEPVQILFALNNKEYKQQVLAQYSLVNFEVLFEGNEQLPLTLRAASDTETYAKLKLDSRIKYAELDTPIKAAVVITDDPFFTLDSTLDDRQWYLPKVKIPEAWDTSKGTVDVMVAVVDTGIHATHLELNDNRVVEGYDFVASKDIRAFSNSDDNGHGTAVAGVIGAIPDNGMGVAGINWKVRLMPVKVLDAKGSGTISSVAQGIVWAADKGASIINLSLGGPGFGHDITLNNAIIYAFNKGALIVAAAGNDLADVGINLDTNPVYPICSDAGSNMVLGVAATDKDDRKASFSNFGINCVDITAPGQRILTPTYLPSEPANNVMIYGSGTSLATPIVSGTAALMKSYTPSMTNVQLRDKLLRTADNIDPLNQNNCLNSSCNGFLGKGRLNAQAAVNPQAILDQSLVREAVTGKIYLVSNGYKRYVSDFVFNQRQFRTDQIIDDTTNQLALFYKGQALPPLEGTLIKSPSDATVYVIHQELKRPLTYLVFLSRGYSFANVKIIPESDLNQLQMGDWYWPPDGIMVLIKGNPTVYVMDQQVVRPVTYFVFTQRKLSFAKVIQVSTDEFTHIPRPADMYWFSPLEGTLVKSNSNPTTYVIENGMKHALSYEAFVVRKYSFNNVKSLPQAEIDVIAPGESIIK